jgi:hypothetical protein
MPGVVLSHLAYQQGFKREALAHRHVTGRGEERGRILLQVGLGAALWDGASPSQQRTEEVEEQATRSLQQDILSSSSSSSSPQLCIFQVVPWWAQLWLHTLRLHYDGQVR